MVCVPDDKVQILIQNKYHCAWDIIYSNMNLFFSHLIVVSVGIQYVRIADSVIAIMDTNVYNVILILFIHSTGVCSVIIF